MVLTDVRKGQRITYRSGDADITAYLSEPATPGTHPGVLVIQPVHGLTELMEVVADRLAGLGYVAMVPALYSRLGTLAVDATKSPPPPLARELQGNTSDPQVVADLQAAMTYLQGRPSVGGQKVGAVGYCAGGRWGLFYAAADPRLAALVAFYPTVTDETPQPNRPVLVWDVIARVNCPVQVLFGDQDHPTVEKYRDRLRNLLAEHGREYEFLLYSGAVHGFANEGSDSYQERVAQAAWVPALDFLKRHLT